MVGMAEIAAGFGSLKAMKDIVQGLNAANLQASINEVKIDLQGLILNAHEALFAAQEAHSTDARRIAELEQEIVQLKNWEAEKQRYELKSLGRSAFAYAVKVGVEDGEPPHWLCERCFGEGHKSLLQAKPESSTEGQRGLVSKWDCNRCASSIWVDYSLEPGADERG